MSKRSWYIWPDMTLVNLAAQGTMLAWEAQQVIALRLAKLAQGGTGASQEAMLMVTEKLQALQEGGALAMRAALKGEQDLNAPEIMRLYRKKVRANCRRLS